MNSPIRYVDPTGLAAQQTPSTGFGIAIDTKENPVSDWLQQKADWHFNNAMNAANSNWKSWTYSAGTVKIFTGTMIQGTKEIFFEKTEKDTRTLLSSEASGEQKFWAAASFASAVLVARIERAKAVLRFPSVKCAGQQFFPSLKYYKQFAKMMSGNQANISSTYREARKMNELLESHQAQEVVENIGNRIDDALRKPSRKE